MEWADGKCMKLWLVYVLQCPKLDTLLISQSWRNGVLLFDQNYMKQYEFTDMKG
jgi:hypothetical protein